MSEFFEEYTHIVADLKPWDYFDIPNCLKRLSWSVDQCYTHIVPQWFKGSLLTRHAVVQLALYACDPFRHIPPDIHSMCCVSRDGTPSKPPGDFYFDRELPDGYYYRAEPVGHLIDQYADKSNDQKQHKYPCPAIVPLIEALATALIRYEWWCEFDNGWPKFQEERERSIAFLETVKDLKKALGRAGFSWENPTLKHKRNFTDRIDEVITIVTAISEHDYQHSGAATNMPHHPRVHGNKFNLLSAMEKAFTTYMPETWPQVATYRALASIMNQMQITNANGKTWSAGAIKTFLVRGPDPRLRLTIKLTTPTIKSWYTRPE
jgi:hypothetical protein